MTKQTETVTISKTEYRYLKERDDELSNLESWGVDNWEGYSDAMRGHFDDQEASK